MTRIPMPTIDSQADDLAARLEMSTAEIGLSVRTTNCLEERGIFTVNDLLHCTREDLLSISNFGEKTLEEVYKALEGVGFYRRHRRRRWPSLYRSLFDLDSAGNCSIKRPRYRVLTCRFRVGRHSSCSRS